MSLDEINLRILATSGTPQQRRYARRIQPIRKSGHWLLVTLLLANTAINETLPIAMDAVLGGSGVTAVIASTAAVVLFGEIIPQALCARYGLAVGAFFARPVRALQYVLAPIAYPIALLLDCVLGSGRAAIYKRAQLKELVSLSDAAHGGNLSADEVTIIRGALELGDKLVADVMTDLDNVYMVALGARLDRALLTEMVHHGHSRVPVYDGCRENIVGVLLVKSLVLLDPDDCTPVRDARIAPVPLVTTHTSLYDILNAFQMGGSHMAVVMGPPPHRPAPLFAATPQRRASRHGSSPPRPPAADAPLLSAALHHHHHHNQHQYASLAPDYIVAAPPTATATAAAAATAAAGHGDIAAYVPIGIITLEDVIEELIQEEIIDETDVFVDMCKRVRVVRAAPAPPASAPACSGPLRRHPDPQTAPCGSESEDLQGSTAHHTESLASDGPD